MISHEKTPYVAVKEKRYVIITKIIFLRELPMYCKGIASYEDWFVCFFSISTDISILTKKKMLEINTMVTINYRK